MGKVNAALAKVSVSGSDHSATGRLSESQTFNRSSIQTVEAVERILDRLIRRLKIPGASFFVFGLKEKWMAGAGQVRRDLELREPEELALLSGVFINVQGRYLQPVADNEYIIGFLAVPDTLERPSSFMEEILGIYSDLLSQELQIAYRKSKLTTMSEKLQKKEEELKKAQQYNTNLLNIATHDLSSPLSAVSGYLDLMNKCQAHDDADRLTDYRHRVESGVQEVMEMLGQLHDIGNIERGKLSVDMVEVNVNWLVGRVTDLLESKAIEKDISFQYQKPRKPVYVKADTVKLKRVLMNLISNAIKYTDEGGEVKVQVDKDISDAYIIINDNGKGIPEAHYSSIFAPFVKLEQSEDFSSSGLGLYVASYFTEMMNGDISVISQEGEGSSFTVTLPRVTHLVEHQQAER